MSCRENELYYDGSDRSKQGLGSHDMQQLVARQQSGSQSYVPSCRTPTDYRTFF